MHIFAGRSIGHKPLHFWHHFLQKHFTHLVLLILHRSFFLKLKLFSLRHNSKIQSLTLFSPVDLASRQSNCGRSKETCACQVFFNLLPYFWPQMPQQWAHKFKEEKKELVFPSTMRMSREKGKASFDFLLFTSRSHFGRSVGGLWPRSFLFVAAALHCWPPTTDQLQTKTFSAQKEKQGQLFVTDLVLISFHSLPNRNLDRSLISFS